MGRKHVCDIEKGGHYWKLYDDGRLHRGDFFSSDQWKVMGAVERNNFGHVIKAYSLEEVLTLGSAIPWRFKNGKQRTFIMDLDHGQIREWRNPTHKVIGPLKNNS